MDKDSMDKNKNKGLADMGEGEFVLNESGTSVTIDADTNFPEDRDQLESGAQTNDTGKEESKKTEDE